MERVDSVISTLGITFRSDIFLICTRCKLGNDFLDLGIRTGSEQHYLDTLKLFFLMRTST